LGGKDVGGLLVIILQI